MNRALRPWWLLLTAVGVATLLATGCTFWRLSEARSLAQASEPFQQRPGDSSLRLLVVGDSTGVGTGASAPSFSVAGLLGAAYPRLAIHNLSRDGARFGDVPGQLAAAAQRVPSGWDLILISVGGNDVIRGTGNAALAQDLDRSFAAARASLAPGGQVLVQPPGNVGNAPFFLPPVSALMNSRAAEMHAAVRTAAARHDVTVVDMARSREQDPFVQHPELNARDGLHPSDGGYRVWRDELLAQTDLRSRLTAAR